jgi:hypothetical protein
MTLDRAEAAPSRKLIETCTDLPSQGANRGEQKQSSTSWPDRGMDVSWTQLAGSLVLI